jgi:predicted permease
VESAGFGSTLPFLSRGNTAGYRIEGRTLAPSDPSDVRFRVTTAGYLATLGAELVAGRLPDARDGAGAPPVAVINRSLANRLWPNGDALGHRIAAGPNDAPWTTIVGVVADVRENGYQIPPMPGLYVLASQLGLGADNLVVRATGESSAIASTVRPIVARNDPEQPVAAIRTMQAIIDLEVVDRRQQSIVLTAFAVTAMLLAALGIHGLVSYSVSLRRREVGLRTALGASIAEVTRALVTRGLMLVAAGIAIGVLLSLAGTRVMEGLLFDIEPYDPLTFAATIVLVAAVSVLATWLPAWRAARLPPMLALRQD